MPAKRLRRRHNPIAGLHTLHADLARIESLSEPDGQWAALLAFASGLSLHSGRPLDLPHAALASTRLRVLGNRLVSTGGGVLGARLGR